MGNLVPAVCSLEEGGILSDFIQTLFVGSFCGVLILISIVLSEILSHFLFLAYRSLRSMSVCSLKCGHKSTTGK